MLFWLLTPIWCSGASFSIDHLSYWWPEIPKPSIWCQKREIKVTTDRCYFNMTCPTFKMYLGYSNWVVRIQRAQRMWLENTVTCLKWGWSCLCRNYSKTRQWMISIYLHGKSFLHGTMAISLLSKASRRREWPWRRQWKNQWLFWQRRVNPP